MLRDPKQVIESILANLKQAQMAANHNAMNHHDAERWDDRDCETYAADAYKQSIKLIETEAAQILAAPQGDYHQGRDPGTPPIIRHLSTGEAVEMVRPFSSKEP